MRGRKADYATEVKSIKITMYFNSTRAGTVVILGYRGPEGKTRARRGGSGVE